MALFVTYYISQNDFWKIEQIYTFIHVERLGGRLINSNCSEKKEVTFFFIHDEARVALFHMS